MLSLKNITLKYSNHLVLDQINLEIDQGEFLIILGSNGSGKSSLLKLIDQRYTRQQGEILLEKVPLEKYSPQALAQQVVTLSQNPLDSLFARLTVAENLQLAMKRCQQKKVNSDYLVSFNPKLCTHFHTLAGQLSGGEQQSLALALACLAQPKILLLDEHTSALDPHTAERLMKMTESTVKAHGITCLLTTHNLELALAYGTRLIALQQGKIIQDFSKAQKEKLSLGDLKSQCYRSSSDT